MNEIYFLKKDNREKNQHRYKTVFFTRILR